MAGKMGGGGGSHLTLLAVSREGGGRDAANQQLTGAQCGPIDCQPSPSQLWHSARLCGQEGGGWYPLSAPNKWLGRSSEWRLLHISRGTVLGSAAKEEEDQMSAGSSLLAMAVGLGSAAVTEEEETGTPSACPANGWVG